MPKYELQRMEDDGTTAGGDRGPIEVHCDGFCGTGPDKLAALAMLCHAMARRARGQGVREPGDYAGGPR